MALQFPFRQEVEFVLFLNLRRANSLRILAINPMLFATKQYLLAHLSSALNDGLP